jgi:hypothetical protein
MPYSDFLPSKIYQVRVSWEWYPTGSIRPAGGTEESTTGTTGTKGGKVWPSH